MTRWGQNRTFGRPLRLIAKSGSMGQRVAAPIARISGEVVSSHEHWQMDASAPELYERYLVPAITSVWANDLLDRIRPTREESVLDIACGTGVVARLVEQRGHGGRLIGIDLNTAMLAVARKKSPAVEWIEGSALNLPFEAGSFDVVLCQLGLQFFPDRPLALREMVRVLKPGGRAGLSVYSAIERTPAAHAFVQALDRYLGEESSRTKRSEHLSCAAHEVGTWARQAGLTLLIWRPSLNKSPSRRCWTMSASSSRRRRWPYF
jgi:ubiquinone/menaquinone biosynthesis C-methylase UbiE